MLDAGGKENLQADADAEDGSTSGKPSIDDTPAVDLVDTRHARGVGTHTRNNESITRHRRDRIGSDLDVSTRTLQSPLSRPQISTAVVQDDDARALRVGHENRWIGRVRSGRGERPLGRGNSDDPRVEDHGIAK